MDALFADFRAALRAIRLRPGLPLVVVLTLGIAGGATSAMLTLGDAILWRPLPFEEPRRLFALAMRHERLGVASELSIPDATDLRASCRSCAGVEFFDGRDVVLGDAAIAPQRREGAAITAGLFPLLGVRPLAGRGLDAEDAARDAAPVVLVGSSLAGSLGGAEAAVGQEIRVDGRPRTVVGVMPPGFRFPEIADLWLPLAVDLGDDRSDRDLDGTLVRLAPGVGREALEAELRAAARALGAAYPESNEGWTVTARPLREAFTRTDSRRRARYLLGAVAFLVLVACANVTNLFLARELSRRRETAVRLALGAGRVGVARRLLAESALLALAGGGVGLLVAPWILDLLLAGNPEEMPYWLSLEIRPEVVFGSLGVALLSGLVFGGLASIRAGRGGLVADLRDGARGSGGLEAQRLQRALVAGEVALALVLLVGAGLFARGFRELLRGEAGFDTGGVLTLRTALLGERFPDRAARASFAGDLLRELRSVSGVEDAVLTTSLPTDDGGAEVRLVLPEQVEREGEETWVSYFGWSDGPTSLDVPLLRGRDLTAAESVDPQASVAVVNRALAERLWPGGDGLGQTIRLGESDDAEVFTVVGVVGDVQYEELGEETPQSELQVHLPYSRLGWPTVVLLVRATGGDAALAALREEAASALHRLEPSLPIWEMRTMAEVRRETTWGERLPLKLVSGFALAALLLGALGVYGVTSFAVSQRVPEIGVRMALGADRPAVERLVLREAAGTAALGVALGLAGALAVARALASLLYKVSAFDPIAFATAAVVLLMATVLAAAIPARRAARIDPMVVLRAE